MLLLAVFVTVPYKGLFRTLAPKSFFIAMRHIVSILLSSVAIAVKPDQNLYVWIMSKYIL